MGYYVHHVPGRLRIRIPELKLRPCRINKVHDALNNLNGIERIEHKRATGSIIIHYDPELMDDIRICNALSYKGLFDKTQVVSSHKMFKKTHEKAGQAIGRIVFNLALGRVLTANGLSFLAALI